MSNLEKAIQEIGNKINVLSRKLDSVESRLATSGPMTTGGKTNVVCSSGGDDEDNESIEEFQNLISEYLTNYMKLSTKFGGIVIEQANIFKKAVDQEFDLIKISAKSRKPDAGMLQKLVEPCSTNMQLVGEFKDKYRHDKDFCNHVATVSEGVNALGWIVVEPKPAPFVAQMKDSSEFYSNRILSSFKGKDDHIQWVKSINGFFKALVEYVKKYHTTGLVWNPVGTSVPAAGASAGGPAPPPPPPAEFSAPPPSSGTTKKQDVSAVFSELSKGTAVTKGLKHVSNDMKTKNRADRSGKVTDAPKKNQPQAATKPVAVKKKKPAVFELKGRKWFVENQEHNKEIIIKDTETSQSVTIYGCLDSVIQIHGKINALSLDNCTKTAVVCDDIVAIAEVVNSQSIEFQVKGVAPSVTLDNCTGVRIYVSREAARSDNPTEFISSKSNELNIVVPGATEDDDPIELPIPIQFKTIITPNFKLNTDHTQH